MGCCCNGHNIIPLRVVATCGERYEQDIVLLERVAGAG